MKDNLYVTIKFLFIIIPMGLAGTGLAHAMAAVAVALASLCHRDVLLGQLLSTVRTDLTVLVVHIAITFIRAPVKNIGIRLLLLHRQEPGLV